MELLGTSCIVPEHAEVANAVGAVTGRVTLTEHAVVSAPRRGLYRIHLGDEPETFYDLALARKAAETALRAAVAAKMARAGAREDDVDVETIWEAESVEVDGRELFVEGRMTVTGTARPRLTG